VPTYTLVVSTSLPCAGFGGGGGGRESDCFYRFALLFRNRRLAGSGSLTALCGHALVVARGADNAFNEGLTVARVCEEDMLNSHSSLASPRTTSNSVVGKPSEVWIGAGVPA
jgi:hypothetical protein